MLNATCSGAKVTFMDMTYPPRQVPIDAACNTSQNSYALDIVGQKVQWDACVVAGDEKLAASYSHKVGERPLAPTEFQQAMEGLAALRAKTTSPACYYDTSFLKLEMTCTSGDTKCVSDRQPPCSVSEKSVDKDALSLFMDTLYRLAQ